MRFVHRQVGELFAEDARRYLEDQVPPAAYRDPLSDHDYLVGTPASKTLLPGFLAASRVTLRKPEYYLIAEQMLPEEIHPEIKAKLDSMARMFGLS